VEGGAADDPGTLTVPFSQVNHSNTTQEDEKSKKGNASKSEKRSDILKKINIEKMVKVNVVDTSTA
jgi:hypothetical protein